MVCPVRICCSVNKEFHLTSHRSNPSDPEWCRCGATVIACALEYPMPHAANVIDTFFRVIGSFNGLEAANLSYVILSKRRLQSLIDAFKHTPLSSLSLTGCVIGQDVLGRDVNDMTGELRVVSLKLDTTPYESFEPFFPTEEEDVDDVGELMEYLIQCLDTEVLRDVTVKVKRGYSFIGAKLLDGLRARQPSMQLRSSEIISVDE